ncbi:hypothetical protein P152DRAFT_516377 [Eremomyces bilateralis CBS 781.70]|uniref:Uncharacterized protein n=1 Tax=Eremomyces bilateralis CBS 781.70 TaxID=1392243 RepID=A0A6G1FW98_9PEZI|nr:uncharacterized protein P152DRAFT_516377 [Eremomyces bilateralis CBS 781.70]KAF1809966.1 hypothetical protein P152DRAFT_516377 [Eremomyces bilateralis CBS 781.70]
MRYEIHTYTRFDSRTRQKFTDDTRHETACKATPQPPPTRCQRHHDQGQRHLLRPDASVTTTKSQRPHEPAVSSAVRILPDPPTNQMPVESAGIPMGAPLLEI